MIVEHEVNKLKNFICGWYHEDLEICDKIIDFHKNSSSTFSGMVVGGKVRLSTKNSIDCVLTDELKIEYANYLQQFINLYIKKYYYSNQNSPWGIAENVNIQHYMPPNGGFHKWHCERTEAVYPNSTRHLVFMTYLNDVQDGGETEFYYQNIKIKPVKGLTLIWPADWTFTHRGLPSLTEEKYIVTGWLNYLEREKIC